MFAYLLIFMLACVSMVFVLVIERFGERYLTSNLMAHLLGTLGIMTVIGVPFLLTALIESHYGVPLSHSALIFLSSLVLVNILSLVIVRFRR